MSHTIRIYNNPRLKKTQRYNLDDTLDIDPFFRVSIKRQTGLPFTKRSWICMGKCPCCRDHNKDQRKLRKQREEQLRFQLREELNVRNYKRI